MLVKVNKICKEEKRVQVTLLDIDDLGSIIPVRELDLRISPSDDSIAETLIIHRMPLFLPKAITMKTMVSLLSGNNSGRN